MFLALGVGAYWVAIFHLFTHAFFKALLFLGSGSVIHAMGGEQDMRHMGGLKNKIPHHPLDHVGRLGGHRRHPRPGRLLLQGRDPVAGLQLAAGLARLLWVVGLTTAAMTAFYMWRLMYMTFYGKSRVKPEVAAHVHESPRVDDRPADRCWPSAACSPAGWARPSSGTCPRSSAASKAGWRPHSPPAPQGVQPRKEAASERRAEWSLMGLSVLVAIVGISLARYLYYIKPGIPDRIQARMGPAVTSCSTTNGTWTRLYDFLFVNGLGKGGGRVCGAFDRNVVDGGVNGAGWLTRFSASVSMWWDTWIVDGVGAAQLLLREDALLPRVHSANRPRAGLRAVCGGGSAGILRVLRNAVSIWTSIY